MIPVPIDPTYLTTYRKEDAKARRIILDGVKDQIVSHIIEIDTTKKMWDVITNMYQNSTMNMKFILRERLNNT